MGKQSFIRRVSDSRTLFFFSLHYCSFSLPYINWCTIIPFLVSSVAMQNLLLCLTGYIFFIWNTEGRIFASWCWAAALAEHLPSHSKQQHGKEWDTSKRAISVRHLDILSGKLAVRLWASFPDLSLTRGTRKDIPVTFLSSPWYSSSRWLSSRRDWSAGWCGCLCVFLVLGSLSLPKDISSFGKPLNDQ